MGKSRQTWEQMYLVATKLNTDVLITIWKDRTQQEEYRNFTLTYEREGEGAYIETSPKHADEARYGFEMGSRRDRIYAFSVGTQEDCHLWVTSIKSALNFMSPSTTPNRSGPFERYSFDSTSDQSSEYKSSSPADDTRVETRRPRQRKRPESQYQEDALNPTSPTGSSRSMHSSDRGSRSRGPLTRKADLKAIAKMGQIKKETQSKIDAVQDEEKNVQTYLDGVKQRLGSNFEEIRNEIQTVESILMGELSRVERDEVNVVLDLRKKLEGRKRLVGDDVQKCRNMQARQTEENMLELSDRIEELVNHRLDVFESTRMSFQMSSSDAYERAFDVGKVSEDDLRTVERRIDSLCSYAPGNPFDAFGDD